MIAEAIQKLLEVTTPTTFSIGGKTFSTKPLHETKPALVPQPGGITVVSLDGLAELITQRFERQTLNYEDALLHVVDFATVRLMNKVSDQDGRRFTLVTAQPVKTEGFKFGEFLEQEDFIIAVASKFADTPDRQYVINVASGLKSGAVRTAEDNGLTQKVTVQRGLSMVQEQSVQPHVMLAPFRTFPEVAQPCSPFLFRLEESDDDELPTLALFEADGGKWKLEAMKAIADYLKARVVLPVIA